MWPPPAHSFDACARKRERQQRRSPVSACVNAARSRSTPSFTIYAGYLELFWLLTKLTGRAWALGVVVTAVRMDTNSSSAQQQQLFAMLGAMAAQFDDDDGEIAAKMAQLKMALATRDAVVAGEHKKLTEMETAGGGDTAGGPSPAALREIQSQIRTVESDLAATEQALTAPDSEDARQLLAATMAAWAPAVMPSVVDVATEAVAVLSSDASSCSSAEAATAVNRTEPEPEREPAAQANGYGTIPVDLAAETKRLADLQAQGLNSDGTPYLHLPGQNEPPP